MKHALIQEKIELFYDLQIPWDTSIETKFERELQKGEEHASIYLDNLCSDYIDYAYDHYAEILSDYMHKFYKTGEVAFEKTLKRKFGASVVKTLLEENLLISCMLYGRKAYQIA